MKRATSSRLELHTYHYRERIYAGPGDTSGEYAEIIRRRWIGGELMPGERVIASVRWPSDEERRFLGLAVTAWRAQEAMLKPR